MLAELFLLGQSLPHPESAATPFPLPEAGFRQQLVDHSDELIECLALDLWVVDLKLGNTHECILFRLAVAEEGSNQV